jgi:large subunit ribosomal protein L10
MSKPVKELVTKELRSRYGELDSALWVELIGADGITTNEFRRDLRSHNIRLEIVKNSLFRQACGDGRLAPLAKGLTGPAALVTGGDSLIEAARIVEEWMPKIKGLKLRGAVLEGEFFDQQRVETLSKMPSKRDLQARIAGCLCSPGASLAAAILSGGGLVAGCVKALIEKLEKQGDAQAA